MLVSWIGSLGSLYKMMWNQLLNLLKIVRTHPRVEGCKNSSVGTPCLFPTPENFQIFEANWSDYIQYKCSILFCFTCSSSGWVVTRYIYLKNSYARSSSGWVLTRYLHLKSFQKRFVHIWNIWKRIDEISLNVYISYIYVRSSSGWVLTRYIHLRNFQKRFAHI